MTFDDQLKSLQERALSDPLLSQEQVGKLMGASVSKLYRLRKAGAGPTWIKLGGTIKYRHSAVQQYLADAEAANT